MIESCIDLDDLRDFAGIAKRWLVWMKSADRHLCKLRTALKRQVSHMAMAIAKYFPTDTRITALKGGLVLWVELNRKVSSLAFYREAQRRRIAILPGVICSTTPKFKHFICISCGFLWSEWIEEGVKVLGELAHQFGSGRIAS